MERVYTMVGGIMKDGRHLFAIYYPELPERQGPHSITDRDTIHRIKNVLRLQEHEQVTLFNRTNHALAVIEQIERAGITVMIESITPNKQYEPSLLFLLPILKKDALAQAVYGLVEAGVSTIQLVICQKSQRAWGGDQEHERLMRMAIAAAEQAKYFAVPEIHAPITLAAALNQLPAESNRFYGDPVGEPLITQLTSKQQPLVLMIGPEGDLTQQEKQLLAQHEFNAVALTPTILRAESAAFCMTALARAAIY